MSGNRKSMRVIVLMGCITALTVFASIAQAQKEERDSEHCGKRRRHHCCCSHKDQQHNWRHQGFAELATKLSLSDQQKAKVKEVFKKSQPQLKPIFSKLINEKREMRTLIQSGSADEAAIRAQAAKVASVEADLAVQRAQIAKQLRAILTPEQIEKFKIIQKEKDSKFDQFREHMREQFDENGPEK
ncbi:MAG: Spy/CpxP family protein refolding chaperone [Gammaproteobacteria bacterium]